MTLAPDPHWQSLLDASDAEEAWLEAAALADRRNEYAPARVAVAPDAATTEAPASTVDQALRGDRCSSARTSADGHPRSEASHSAEPSPTVSTAADCVVQSVARAVPRVCGFCGHRDPCWNGRDGRGWGAHEGRLACPDCLWIEPWNDEREVV